MSMGLRSPYIVTARRLVAIILVGLVFLACASDGASRGHLLRAGAPRRSLTDTTNRKVFDVTAFGAKPESGDSKGRKMGELPGGGDPTKQVPVGDNGKDDGPNPDGNNDTGVAFIKTWVAACRGEYKGPAKVLIPKGTFLTGPMVFQGPCTSSKDIVVEIQGEVKATTDLSDYPSPEWIQFESIDGLIVTGDGVVNGQGEKTWNGNGCDKDDCPHAPSSLKFIKVKNALIEGITSLNSKYFHYHVTDCSGVTLDRVHITAPGDSPNTDGCHISDSDNVKVINSVIATGDDCVSIGQGARQITVNNVTCGPGHGISVGSLGKYKNEQPVVGVNVTNCRLSNTTNGARIKTWANENGGEASGIVFDNLVLDHVKAPIVIDQHYGMKKDPVINSNNPNAGAQSLYKLRDIHFRNIKGTSSQNVAVSLACSAKNPCDGVELNNIDIAFGGAATNKNTGIASECYNAKVTTKGTINPAAPACK
ncbi:exopolygalacturonase-like [Argentina anserina]|uniref:exopolygalacturonase-like n=1 Tax=Argentina anserina TaxID=57926 RepID=UPI0021763127|nr:exopolygalacturonase-like [Potentilla anserina]